MKYTKTLLAALLLSMFAFSQPADAQFRRLKERAKDRAKERLTQHAEKKVDDVVDKVVDESVARTENKINKWISDAFDGTASVSDDGVLSRDGREDVQLAPNKSGPSNTDHVRYLEITTLKVPGFASFGGMTTATEFFLHDGRSATDDATSMSILDLNSETITNADHNDKTYWKQSFAEMAEMLNTAVDGIAENMEEMQQSIDEAEEAMEESKVEMEYSFDVDDTGETENINGIRARRFVYTIEAIASGENDEGVSTKFYTIVDTWVSTAVAGYETLTSYYSRMANAMGADVNASSMAEKMEGLSFLDPRIGGSMKKAAEKMKEATGLPIKSVTYMVSVPEGKRLDRSKVFRGESVEIMASDEAQQTQRTIMITETYISNLNGDSFASSKLEVPSNYKMIESPIKTMLEAMENQK